MKVRIFGDPKLRLKSEPIDQLGASERVLIQEMIKTMYQDHGIGLAAPQVGINKQLFVADIGDGPFAVINPQILKKRNAGYMEEGCLCLPGITINVKRPQEIVVRYKDENNQTVERTMTDMLARVFQHETDHLFGKMIVDYASWSQKLKIKKQLRELEQLSQSQ